MSYRRWDLVKSTCPDLEVYDRISPGTKRAEPPEPYDLEEEGSNTLCTALMETNLARDKRKTQQMLYTHQLLATRNYEAMVFLGNKEKRTSTLAIRNTGAGPKFMKLSLGLAARSLLNGQVKALRLRTEGSSPPKVAEKVTTKL